MSSAESPPAFGPTDDPLRQDVRLLGVLLGQVLIEQGGRTLFERVEAARLAAIQRRKHGHGLGPLSEALSGIDPADVRPLVHAFSTYFSLTNLAEQVHRIRRRRDHALAGSLQAGSLEAVLARLARDGVGSDRVLQLLRELEVIPVFTAHPTEATRPTILRKEQRLSRALVDRIERERRTPEEERRILERLRMETTLIWQTEEQPPVSPSVADEAEHVQFFLVEVVYRVVPALYEALARALEATYGPVASTDELPGPIVRFGSWVGGDMDGNPKVGAETVLATLGLQRGAVVERYRREVLQLFEHLSQAGGSGVAASVIERGEAYRQTMSDVRDRLPTRSEGMPYRVLLWLMSERLRGTLSEGAHAYAHPAAFLEDLELILRSLEAHRGLHAGVQLVRRLRERVRTFGFHLATLDLRQHAEVHREVVGQLLSDPAFSTRPAAERAVLLRAALSSAPPPFPPALDADASRSLEAFRAIRAARLRFGPEAIGPYIISMAQGIDDVLAVLLLARVAGLQDGEELPLDVAPLFETVDDLDHARATLGEMLGDPLYRAHLRSRGDRQLVMLGYSDSSKISGVSASRWALYRAQEELVAEAEAAGVLLTLFHGRGGTVARGGSKPREAILADPRGAVRGRLRVTEQGEIINSKYGLRGIAERTLELSTGAVLEATALGESTRGPEPAWRTAMETVAEGGRAAYAALIHDDPDFLAYFRDSTPIDVIERLQIGSRPASRRPGAEIDQLRAIPWVFAWTQSRQLLPGWFGLGAGLQAGCAGHGRELLKDMAARWPFFGNLLADAEMSLAKADLEIAAHYAGLAGAGGERIFPLIHEAFRQTRQLVLELRGEDELLDREPVLQRAIRLRNPYVDPMSLIQVDLLRRWRAGDRRDAALERALFTTVRGIARGLRNTG